MQKNSSSRSAAEKAIFVFGTFFSSSSMYFTTFLHIMDLSETIVFIILSFISKISRGVIQRDNNNFKDTDNFLCADDNNADAWKRQLAEMELSEFVVASLIADLAAHPLQDLGIPLINGLVPITTLFCCEVLLIWISGKSIFARKLLFGKPSILIDHGRINVREMENNRFSNEELMQELRNKDCLDIDKVQYAILETDGHVNVIMNPQDSPLTAGQMGKT